MPYIPLTDNEGTNLQRTLLHSPETYEAYMRRAALAALCAEFVGQRGVNLYCHAISEGSRCLVCGAFFRKALMDGGDDPDSLVLSEEERLLAELGYSIAEDPHSLDPALYAALRERYNDEQLVALIGLGGMMAATNLFNTVAKVPLDEGLEGYRRRGLRE